MLVAIGFPEVPPIPPGPLTAVTAALLNCSGYGGEKGGGEGSDMRSNDGTASVESICVNKQVGTHFLVSFSPPFISTCSILHSHSFNCPSVSPQCQLLGGQLHG